MAASNRTAREFRGAALEIQTLDAPEFIIAGPAETGKTIAALTRLDRLARTYPRSQHVILRKTYLSAVSSVVLSFILKVLPKQTAPWVYDDVRVFGGGHPQWFDYANGSRIWIGGLDNPDKVLSTERDSIYVNQAEELTVTDWEYLTTRATGRAGNLPFGQVFGDCNPAGPGHWILKRNRLHLLTSRHEDNPLLFTVDGEPTEQGRKTLETLDELTGVRKERLRYGRWVQAEGVVYPEFDTANLTEAEPDPDRPIELAADDGYVDPRVFLFIQRTPHQILVFDEIYHKNHLAATCVNEAVEKCGGWYGWVDEEHTRARKLPELCVGPPEAKELQERFRAADVAYRHQSHKIVEGVAVVRRLVCDENGQRVLQVHKRCRNLISELTDGYKYPVTGSWRSDETPLDKDNHAVDALRYWCWVRARR